MKMYQWSRMSDREKQAVFARPADRQADAAAVRGMVEAVRAEGDAALLRLTEKFDGVKLDSLTVAREELQRAWEELAPELREALAAAQKNLEAFHRAQLPEDVRVETQAGVTCEQVSRSIGRVGLYIPGGMAPLFSTVLMLAVPARLAGCREIVMATPPRKDGSVHPAILAAAELAGVSEVVRVGGAQAIAALAFGTESVRPVNKIFGPGNAWVTEAKRQVGQMSGRVGIDLPAGPSEVLVIADAAADARFVAWDLLSQAEHGPDSQVILVSPAEKKIAEVFGELEKVLPSLPRQESVRASLVESRAIVCRDLAEAVEISNLYAPEHLIINTENARELLAQVTDAGSVFLGAWSPESVGDYASGTNHVLPTSGAALFTGGVSTASFLRRMTVQELSRDGLNGLAKTVMTMAENEGLYCHAQAVAVRAEENL